MKALITYIKYPPLTKYFYSYINLQVINRIKYCNIWIRKNF